MGFLAQAGLPAAARDAHAFHHRFLAIVGAERDKAQGLGAEEADLNAWWRDGIRGEFGLPSFLEIEFETHFLRFLMPTIRGAETGSKKRYAGTVRNADGELEVVFKGVESVRSDWTPLAQSF